MRIAAEVLEHRGGAGEGTFGVDDPVGAAELIEPRGEGDGLGQGREGAGEAERALGEGAAEGVEVLAAEDGRQGADGKEKPLSFAKTPSAAK